MAGRRPDILPNMGMLIKREIVAAGPEGITQKALCNVLKIPRMTANRHCKQFAKKGKIKIIREGTVARYVAKSKIVMDPQIGAYTQGRRAYLKIMRKGPAILFNQERIRIDLQQLTELEVTLLYFSNIAGALFSYILVQAMSQGNPILHREYHRKAAYYMNEVRKDRLVREWIDGFLSGVLASAPYRLKKLLYRTTGHHPTRSEARMAFHEKGPRLSIDEPGVTEQALAAFGNIYPNIFRTLNRISQDLPKAVDTTKASLDAFEKSGTPGLYGALAEGKEREVKAHRVKSTHAHSFKLLKIKAGIKYYECTQCHKKKTERVSSK